MVKLSEKTQEKIKEYVKVVTELKKFDAEIKEQKSKLAKMKEQQEQEFDFERATQISMLSNIITQAEQAYRNKNEQTVKVREANSLQIHVSQDVRKYLEADDELKRIEMEIMKNIEAIKKGIVQYRSLYKDKRDKARIDILKMEEVSLSNATTLIPTLNERNPFNNLMLEKVLDQYENPQKN